MTGRRRRTPPLLHAAGVLLVSCTPAIAAPVDAGPPLELDGVSLTLTLTFAGLTSLPPRVSHAMLPTTLEWTVHLSNGPDAGTIVVVHGLRGDSSQVTFTRDGNVLHGELHAFPVDTVYDCETIRRFSVVPLALTLLDADGDGRADGATGTGSGAIEGIAGDVLFTASGAVSVVGTLDHEPPTLRLASDDGVALSVEHLWVLASEPIPASAFPVLDLGPGHAPRAFTPRDGTAEWASSFFLGTDRFPAPGATPSDLLPFGAEGRVVSPAFRDLVGNDGPLDLPVAIAPDVGLLAENGFEEPMPALVMEGGARFVTGLGTVSAISGARSLLIPRMREMSPSGVLGGRIVARLAVMPGDTHVHASMRLVGDLTRTPNFYGELRLLSSDGELVELPSPIELAGTTTVTAGDADYNDASNVFVVDAPLPASATHEVVVVMSTLTGPCGLSLLSFIGAGLLVDDLRVE